MNRKLNKLEKKYEEEQNLVRNLLEELNFLNKENSFLRKIILSIPDEKIKLCEEIPGIKLGSLKTKNVTFERDYMDTSEYDCIETLRYESIFFREVNDSLRKKNQALEKIINLKFDEKIKLIKG